MSKVTAKEMSKSKGGGSVGLSYPTLTRENYTACSMKMRVFMQAHSVWEAVEPSDPKNAIDGKLDKVALAMIYQGILEDVLLSITDKKTAKRSLRCDQNHESGSRSREENANSNTESRIRGYEHEGH